MSRRIDFDSKKVSEAFRAGNRARKKESAVDAVESVDSIQAQIDLFKEQTGKDLEIRDGRPYFDGDLWLKGCTRLTSLPDRLKVGGDLDLKGCTGLISLPDGLEIGGYLDLKGCTRLTSLPNGLKVGGLGLWLQGCTGLTGLSGDLEVGGDLKLEGCTGLTRLPDGLKVGGGLWLQGCTGLTSLPNRLKVGENLYLQGCTGLTSLPDDLEVGRVLGLSGCDRLTKLPDGLKVKDDLYLEGCTGLTSLPNGLKVRGTLFLGGCTGLTSLPNGLEVGGNLDLPSCTGLTGLPSDLVVQGTWINHCGILKSFFKKLGIRVDRDGDTKAEKWRNWQKANGYITEAFKAGNRARKKESAADTVESVESVDDMQAQIDLFKKQTGIELEIRDGHPYLINGMWLADKTGLTGLPTGLKINGGLYLMGCTGLTSLPDGLEVGGDLNLRGCTGLTGLPFDLIVQGKWIKHDDILTPFFRKLRIPVDKDGDTLASYWHRWQKAHGYLTEAFKAGNRARKKESVQDAIEGVDIQVTKKTCTETVEKFAKSGRFSKIGINDLLVHVMSDTAAEIGGFDKVELFTAMQGHGFWKENTLWTEVKSDTGWFPDIYIGDGVNYGEYEPGGICYIWFTNKRTPGEPVAWHRITPYSRWIIYDRFVDIIKDIIIRARRENIPAAVNEAFKAGNRARKKETAQDTVGIFDDLLITPDRVRDYIGTDIQSVEKMCTNGSWRELINRLLSEVFEKPHSNVHTYTKHENGVSISTYYYTGRESHIMVSGNNGYVMRLRVDGEGHPDKFTVGITFYDKGIRCLRDRGGDKEYETVLERDNWRRDDGYEFNDEGLLMFCQFLSTGIVPAGFSVKDVVLDEAFRAGNKARKKEAMQDTVDSIDDIQTQIDLFKKQTGIELKIKDGRPYFNGDLNLVGCTGLTSLPEGLKVNGRLDLDGCTGLTSLPAGLEVNEDLALNYCTGLTSLPFDLIVRGFWIEHKRILTPFFRKLGIRVNRIEYTEASYWRKWQKAHGYLTEAFKAGNRARKKEFAQDTVESVNDIQAQIDRFREQTGKDLEIRDGHPYFDGSLVLFDCAGLTSLPNGLKVKRGISLTMCTGLTSLPAGLEVGGNLRLDACPGLTSLPADLKVGGELFLRFCAGLTSLPAGLEVEKDLYLDGNTGLTSLPDRLKVKGNLWLTGNTGLTSLIRLPSDLVVQGDWIKHHGKLTPFFEKLGIWVNKDGDTLASDWRDWQKAHGYLTEAFRAGNRARKKEAMQDAAAVTDSVNLSFMDTIGEIESFLCRRGEQEDRVMTAEGDAIDSGKWFDWRGRTEDYQALVIEVENIDGDTCNVYVYVDATGVPSTFDATGQHRMDFECTGSLSNRTVLNNVLNIFDRLAGPAGEDELPEDLREGDENWEIYNNLIQRHADFLRPFLCKQDLDRLIVDGVIDEAFKAGNRARKKESAQDTAESADRPVTFDEALGEIERLIHRIGSKYKRGSHNNLYSKQRPEAQAEIFHIHPFSSNELTDNDVSRDGFYPGGWSEKVTHSYDAVVDLAYFPELDRTFVMMCANVCTVDPGDIRHMSVFNRAGSYSEYYMGDYMDKDPLRDAGDYDLMGSEFFYPIDTVSDLGRILKIVTYLLTDKRWLACMALFTVCRSFSSQYTRNLLPGAICPYIRKDIRISPEMLHSAVNGALWNELLVKSNGLCGAIVDGRFTYKEILDMFEPDEYRSESGQPKVKLW